MTTVMSTRHTPGPWVVASGIDICALVGTPEAITVASTQFFEGAPTERQLADARLIAAAPDLAEALLDLAEVVNEIATEQCEAGINVGYWNRTTGEGWRAARAAEAALTKAGVQP